MRYAAFGVDVVRIDPEVTVEAFHVRVPCLVSVSVAVPRVPAAGDEEIFGVWRMN